MAEGFLLIDKDGGWTSHDVVDAVRRLARTRRVGHAGTLDPMATGLLVVALGRATRLLRFVQAQPKRYEATAVFGIATDTLDADGEVVATSPMVITAADVAEVLPRFRGRITQIPPMVSALKVGGRRLHEIARRGEEVERPSREVQVHDLALTSFQDGEYPVVGLAVTCSTGTYVRTLADDVARALGGRAHLSSLRRLAIGSLGVDRAHRLAGLEAAAEEGRLAALLLPANDALGDLPAVAVDEAVATAVGHGRPIGLTEGEDGPVRVIGPEGTLLAVYRAQGGRARAEVVLS